MPPSHTLYCDMCATPCHAPCGPPPPELPCGPCAGFDDLRRPLLQLLQGRKEGGGSDEGSFRGARLRAFPPCRCGPHPPARPGKPAGWLPARREGRWVAQSWAPCNRRPPSGGRGVGGRRRGYTTSVTCLRSPYHEILHVEQQLLAIPRCHHREDPICLDQVHCV